MPAAVLQKPDSRALSWGAHSLSIHGPFLHRFLVLERISRLRRELIQNLPCNVFAHGRAMFEPVSRPAANKPHVLHLRVSVDQKISVRGILVLADARLDHRRVSHRRKAAADVVPHYFRFRSRWQARLCVGIDALSMMV